MSGSPSRTQAACLLRSILTSTARRVTRKGNPRRLTKAPGDFFCRVVCSAAADLYQWIHGDEGRPILIPPPHQDVIAAKALDIGPHPAFRHGRELEPADDASRGVDRCPGVILQGLPVVLYPDRAVRADFQAAEHGPVPRVGHRTHSIHPCLVL